ncbi:hypothetical protein EV361DRAFT_866747 [Lentinula raphanica]|nr:hypothetical protein EV361DRAFT_866747 [Lentinula raphanica]
MSIEESPSFDPLVRTLPFSTACAEGAIVAAMAADHSATLGIGPIAGMLRGVVVVYAFSRSRSAKNRDVIGGGYRLVYEANATEFILGYIVDSQYMKLTELTTMANKYSTSRGGTEPDRSRENEMV